MNNLKSVLGRLKEFYNHIQIELLFFFPINKPLFFTQKKKFTSRKINDNEIQSYSVSDIKFLYNNLSQSEFLRNSYEIVADIKWDLPPSNDPNRANQLKSAELQIRELLKFLDETKLNLPKVIFKQINNRFKDFFPEGILENKQGNLVSNNEQLQPVITFIRRNTNHITLLIKKCQKCKYSA